MKTNKTKEHLINTTKDLLLKTDNLQELTARRIAEEADINVSMINYYFGSKDKLIKKSTNLIIEDEFENFTLNEDLDGKENLKLLIYSFGKMVLKYKDITRLSIPYILLEEKIELPYKLIPYIERCFDGKKNIYISKLIAYEITSFLQVVLYRLEDFSKYMSIDLENDDELKKFIDIYIENLVGGV